MKGKRMFKFRIWFEKLAYLRTFASANLQLCLNITPDELLFVIIVALINIFVISIILAFEYRKDKKLKRKLL